MSEREKRKVLITGAGGKIGSTLAVMLKDRYDLRLHYHSEPKEIVGEDRVIANISNLDEVLPIMEGIDTVFHFAGDPRVPASWESVLQANIIGMYNVLEAAKRASVRKVVFASTNHVMGMYDENADWPVYNDMPQRPDSYYGVSKAFGEDIGRFYFDRWNLQFIALRIGWYMVEPKMDAGYGRAMWLSPRDCAHAFERAAEANVECGVYYAISDNPDRPWDLTNGMLELGYSPQDSWREHYDDE
ncbi:MAG: NAD-dependent epimerase/dehydratase family protein [Thermomicrobiales bacterium]